MEKRFLYLLSAASLMLLGAFSPIQNRPEPVLPKAQDEPESQEEPAEEEPEEEEPIGETPVLITGAFEYTNEFVVETYFTDHAVSLLDMTGFVLRDYEWELPVEGQVLGFMDLDEENDRGTFRLALPAVPEGFFNDVDFDGQEETGLQIFAVGYSPNLTGGVFSTGDDRTLGWPGYLASVTTDSENNDEVTGGKLVIWAADGDQEFPSGFGKDGLLFTKDDPVMSVPAGYSVVDLDETPFEIIRERSPQMRLYEPEDIKVKDVSGLSYTEAFDALVEFGRREYAFNGIEGKEPDWEAVYAEIAPRVEAAQQEVDPYAFFLALNDFSLKFNDGHVGLDGGQMQYRYNEENVLGGWGFAAQELEDGRVIAAYILPDGPADRAGMALGAEITRFDGQEIQTALEAVPPFEPQSTEWGRRHEQVVFLTRGPIGKTITVKFINPVNPDEPADESKGWWERFIDFIGRLFSALIGKGEEARMTSVYEVESLLAVYMGGERDELVMPTEYDLLPSGVGYIKLNANYDDLSLLVRVFERALESFAELGVPGIIVDLRRNFGGSNRGLAGFLHDEEILMGQLEYYSDRTGEFEPDGPREKVFPNENQYRFGSMVLLVDQFCYSACELEAYGFSQVPGMTVMGQFPTAGVEAETARGKFLLPEGMEFTMPTGRFTNPDGSIFLEGQGVQPDVDLPVTEETVLAEYDAVLQEAVDYILGN